MNFYRKPLRVAAALILMMLLAISRAFAGNDSAELIRRGIEKDDCSYSAIPSCAKKQMFPIPEAFDYNLVLPDKND